MFSAAATDYLMANLWLWQTQKKRQQVKIAHNVLSVCALTKSETTEEEEKTAVSSVGETNEKETFLHYIAKNNRVNSVSH